MYSKMHPFSSGYTDVDVTDFYAHGIVDITKQKPVPNRVHFDGYFFLAHVRFKVNSKR